MLFPVAGSKLFIRHNGSWVEIGSPETLVERTRCARCHKPLPEGHHKFCSDLCGKLHRDYAREMKEATEDQAIFLAVRSAGAI